MGVMGRRRCCVLRFACCVWRAGRCVLRLVCFILHDVCCMVGFSVACSHATHTQPSCTLPQQAVLHTAAALARNRNFPSSMSQARTHDGCSTTPTHAHPYHIPPRTAVPRHTVRAHVATNTPLLHVPPRSAHVCPCACRGGAQQEGVRPCGPLPGPAVARRACMCVGRAKRQRRSGDRVCLCRPGGLHCSAGLDVE